MDSALIVGVDPGLVHTGLVALQVDGLHQRLDVFSAVINGPDEYEVLRKLKLIPVFTDKYFVTTGFIERYKPRHNYGVNTDMIEAQSRFTSLLGPRGFSLVLNTGVKKVIRKELMSLFNVWDFNTPTHHQDLRAAARIGLYGAVKNDELNKLLYLTAYSKIRSPHNWVTVKHEL